MNDDKHKIIQELLKEVFDNVNNWLTHAEAKNAALIAFNVACLSIIWDMKDISKVKFLLYIICIGMLLSTVMALISFIPRMGKGVKNNGGHSEHDNLLFYMDIGKYCKEDYIKAVFKQYAYVDILDTQVQKIEKDLSDEITYNATVVIRKYKWFWRAATIDIVILVMLMVMIVVA